MQISLKKPLSLKQFKELSDDLKIEYLSWLRDEFNASASAVSKDLWNKEAEYLSVYMRRNLPDALGVFTKRGRRMTREQAARWVEFLGYGYNADARTGSSILFDLKCAKQPEAPSPKRITVEIDGEHSTAELCALLKSYLAGKTCSAFTFTATFD